jgi:hypothetical protein
MVGSTVAVGAAAMAAVGAAGIIGLAERGGWLVGSGLAAGAQLAANRLMRMIQQIDRMIFLWREMLYRIEPTPYMLLTRCNSAKSMTWCIDGA